MLYNSGKLKYMIINSQLPLAFKFKFKDLKENRRR